MSNNKKTNLEKTDRNYPAIFEILPLFLFFALNKYYNIFIATGVLIVTCLVNLIASYLYTKKFHPISVITAILAVIFGGMTLFFHNESFIKIKVTVINLCFALTLMSSGLFKTNFLKMVFASHFDLAAKGWAILNGYWIAFFLLLAAMNEIIWRNFSTDSWVNFKVFGILVLSFLFMIIQFPIIKKYKND